MQRPPHGKIIMHGTGLGDITDSDVEKRAREIAVIRGRDAEAVSEEDRAEAWAELNGDLVPPTAGTDGEGRGGLTRDPSEPVSDTGHQVVTENTDDESDAREQLANEGVEEAQHDQMLASREHEHRQDRS